MTNNRSKPDLDLSDINERLTVKVGKYAFTIPADIPTPTFVKMARAFTVISEAAQNKGSYSQEMIEAADVDLWVSLDVIMTGADPPPDKPVRELFNGAAALRFLGLLAAKFGEVTNSTDFSPSSSSTTVA